MLDAAVRACAPVEALYYAPQAMSAPQAALLLEQAQAAGARTFALQPGVLERVADAATPQPVIGVIGRVDRSLDEVLAACPARAPFVVCVDVRDPGNLGSILRSADAAGAAAVVCCGTSTDPYNPKTVRASAGSIFHVPLVVDVAAGDVLEALGRAGYLRAGTMARGGEDYAGAELGDRVALVLGNEAHGLDPAIAGQLDARLSIPMSGGAESLNVAMAATVLCFELARRRRAADAGQPAGAAATSGGESPFGGEAVLEEHLR